MVILIPFSLLKLRDRLTKHHSGPFTEEELESLKSLIEHDIMGSIKKNYQLGNINERDYRKLIKLTSQLFTHIYSEAGIEEEDIGMDMSIILPEDITEYKLELAEKEILTLKEEKQALLAEIEQLKAQSNK